MTRAEKITLLQGIQQGKTIEELTAGTAIWVVSGGMYEGRGLRLTETEFADYQARYPYFNDMIIYVVPPIEEEY